MVARALLIGRVAVNAAPRRRVSRACSPDLDAERTVLKQQLLDIEPAILATPPVYVDDVLVSTDKKRADEWKPQSVSTAPKEDTGSASAADKKPERLGEYLMQTAPVRYYMHNLETNPLTTKCWTSFTGFFIGDVVAQLLTEPDFAISRTLILAGYGFFIDAPAGNAFYTWMDKTIHPTEPKSAKAVGIKIAIDQLIYAPIFTVVLYIFLQSAHLDFEGIPAALNDKVIPTLLANWTVWPLAHGLNFYYVPTEQRILYNNFVAVCWTTWLSFLAH